MNTPEISVTDVGALVQAGAVLLDVREDHEWIAGHAPDAMHVPMSRLSERVGEIPTDRQIVCVCHVGARSAAVASALNNAGFTALNVDGGMDAWVRAGLPVVTNDGQSGSVV